MIEETELKLITLSSFLGKRPYTFESPFYGRKVTHIRYYFHFQYKGELKKGWETIERTPSEDPGHQITLRFRWIDLSKKIPELIARQGEMIPILLDKLSLNGK